MSSKLRFQVAFLSCVTGVLVACDDYAPNPTESAAGDPSSAIGAIGPGAAGGAPSAGSAPVGGPSSGGITEGNPMLGGLAGASSGGSTGQGSPAAPGDAVPPPAGVAGAGGAGAVVTERGPGPCDIFAASNTPCVAAYSTVRALSSSYDGPLYQVRKGAPNPLQNTGTGGQTQDIGLLPSGFADAAAQVAFCGIETCTVSAVYDQSGRGNTVTVAKRGRIDGGQFGDDDDFESRADAGALTVGGNEVFSLYMEARHGYRQTVAGAGVPRGQEPQGIYMLADGTRVGTACCWDFGNVTTDPTQYHVMNTLFFGQAFWGRGAGNGPWFMADFEAGVWAGGSNPGDPGWGALNEPAPINANNPSLRVRFALGFLKTATNYALRMADVQTATDLTTAYEGPLPKAMDNQGAIVIGVGGDNSNNSFGTFFEGAVVAGYPSNDAELAVLQNVQAAGYGQ
ncbi:MAG: hypothetical protein RL685_4183 [Pseudomonadota bacterium]|jgi:hypothetical protein